MAEDLILSDLAKQGKTEFNLVLDDSVILARTESVEGEIFWRWEDEPETAPQLLGSAAAGKSLSTQFNLQEGRAIRLFLVSKTATGDLSVSDVREAVQVVYDPTGGLPPSGLSASETTPGQADLVWTNNGGTGDNVIERKTGVLGAYTMIDTVSSSTDTYTDAVADPDLYYYRIRNEDIPGYSNVVLITLTP